jgi:hypothetical protein
MKIHGMCLVKNEADVLQETLTSALHWCDYIYVFDNGSSDGTWELVKELANQHPQIVPYKQDDVKYSEGLGSDIFNAFRSNVSPRDWWCVLDADEFYIDDPRIFLAKIPNRFQVVWGARFTYYFTDQDAISYQQDPGRYLAMPVQQRLRYYLAHCGEVRFFRHSEAIVWSRPQAYTPVPDTLYAARTYPVRIWYKHYQYRSPEQIERRLATRRPLAEAGTAFQHEGLRNWGGVVAAGRDPSGENFESVPLAGTRWEERLVPAASLNYDAFDRRFVIDESLLSASPIRLSPSHLRKVIRKVTPQPIRATLGRLRHRTMAAVQRLQPSRGW